MFEFEFLGDIGFSFWRDSAWLGLWLELLDFRRSSSPFLQHFAEQVAQGPVGLEPGDEFAAGGR